MGAEIARTLSTPLDLLLVRKIGATLQPELAVGAVIDGSKPMIVRNDQVIALTETTEAEFQRRYKAELAEIERRRVRYMQGHTPSDPAGKTAIVVDDGIATGATKRAALRALRQRRPAELILAIPIAPSETVDDLQAEVDRVICLYTPQSFFAVGSYYRDFHQLSAL